MQYGIQFEILGNIRVSNTSTKDLAITIAKSWRRKIHPEAIAVQRKTEADEWEIIDEPDQ